MGGCLATIGRSEAGFFMSEFEQENGAGAQIARLIGQIAELEAELEAEMARRAAQLRVAFVDGRLKYEQDVLRRHRELQSSLWNYLRSARVLVVITAPVIYALILPLVLLDIFITIYQFICFPV
jgi:anti-sigma-K factor RskA